MQAIERGYLKRDSESNRFLIVTCIHAGDANKGGCQLSDIKTSWMPTGKVVGGKEQYLEIIENKCSCPQGQGHSALRCH